MKRLILFSLFATAACQEYPDGFGPPDDQTGTCTDSCATAFDGECDDGGPGAEFAICLLGTDCGDCGPRAPGLDANLPEDAHAGDVSEDLGRDAHAAGDTTPDAVDEETDGGLLPSLRVGPDGGTISHAETGASLTIPPGALTSEVSFTFEELQVFELPVLPDWVDTSDLGRFVSIEPHDTAFALPAQLTLPSGARREDRVVLTGRPLEDPVWGPVAPDYPRISGADVVHVDLDRLGVFVSVPAAGAPDGTGPRVYTLPTPVSDLSDSPMNVLSSALGPDETLHIVWSAPTGEESHRLVHGTFDLSTREFQQGHATPDAARTKCPDLVVDDSGVAHAVYFLRREPEGLRAGNSAITYVEFDDGVHMYSVSENPAAPELDADGLFLADVDARPQIALEGDRPVVFWDADSNSETNWDTYIVRAIGTGGGWEYTQLFEPRGLTDRTFHSDNGFAVPRPYSSSHPIGWIDISDYLPHLATESGAAWTVTTLDSNAIQFGRRHIQGVVDSGGTARFIWVEDSDDGPVAVVGAVGLGSRRVPLRNSFTGSFMPATLGPNDELVFAYDSPGATAVPRSLSVDGVEAELPDVGRFCGRRALHALGDMAIVVTCDVGDDGDAGISVTVVEGLFE